MNQLFSSVTQSSPTVCDPMDCSSPGFPVHHQSPELTQTHVHQVGDAIQPPNPLLHFFYCLQSFPAFPTTKFFTPGGHSTRVSALASLLPMNIEDWLPLGLTGWISLQSKGLSKSLLQHHSSKASSLRRSAFFIVQLSHPYMTTGKTMALTRWTFIGKIMSLLFNMLSWS